MTVTLKYLSDNLVRLRGPVLEISGTASTGGTCTALLFDDKKDSFLTSNHATSATTINVRKASRFVVGDELRIELDDGTFNTLAITAVDAGANTVTVEAPGIASAASEHNRVSVVIGTVTGVTANPIAMSAYGTPVVGTYDWGYRGTIESTHAGLRPGLAVRVEIVLNDAGAVLTENLKAVVSGGT